MSAPYPVNGAVPGPNDLLSQSQGQIQTNFANIVGWAGIDHVAYGSTGAGFHEQVTFNTATNPGAGTITPPVLFTNTQDGKGNTLPGSLAQLFFYTGASSSGQTQFVSLANGSVLLTGGIILKWGTQTKNNGDSISFSSVCGSNFPNNCFGVIASIVTNTTSGAVTVNPYNILNTGFNVQIIKASGSTLNGTLNFIAIGN